jgi:hypothetical protein
MSHTTAVPRYVLHSLGGNTYDLPIVASRHTSPFAVLAVGANDFKTALRRALEWATMWSAKHCGDYYPQVSYKGARYRVKRLDNGNAYIESNSRGKWVPVEVLGK